MTKHPLVITAAVTLIIVLVYLSPYAGGLSSSHSESKYVHEMYIVILRS